jgi:hypothetical protein
MNAGNRESCRKLYKKLNILPLQLQYILPLLLFVVQNIGEFTSNAEVHGINTSHKSDLYPPSIKLTKCQKGAYYSGIKVFNHLPHNIKNLSHNVKQFKLALKKFLLRSSFYTLDEYFDWISTSELATFMQSYVILNIYLILKTFMHNQ